MKTTIIRSLTIAFLMSMTIFSYFVSYDTFIACLIVTGLFLLYLGFLVHNEIDEYAPIEPKGTISKILAIIFGLLIVACMVSLIVEQTTRINIWFIITLAFGGIILQITFLQEIKAIHNGKEI